MNCKLERLVRQHATARDRLKQALDTAYPAGMQVAFKRSSRQVNPSFGVVVGGAVDNHPYIIIRGDSGKRKAAWISLDAIITMPNATLHLPTEAQRKEVR